MASPKFAVRCGHTGTSEVAVATGEVPVCPQRTANLISLMPETFWTPCTRLALGAPSSVFRTVVFFFDGERWHALRNHFTGGSHKAGFAGGQTAFYYLHRNCRRRLDACEAFAG